MTLNLSSTFRLLILSILRYRFIFLLFHSLPAPASCAFVLDPCLKLCLTKQASHLNSISQAYVVSATSMDVDDDVWDGLG